MAGFIRRKPRGTVAAGPGHTGSFAGTRLRSRIAFRLRRSQCWFGSAGARPRPGVCRSAAVGIAPTRYVSFTTPEDADMTAFPGPPGPPGQQGGEAPSVRQELVASFDHYLDVQRLVDHMSDGGFPVEHVRIIGDGVRTVEHVTGRMTTGKAALAGAGSGAWFGLLIGSRSSRRVHCGCGCCWSRLSSVRSGVPHSASSHTRPLGASVTFPACRP
ncbi:general stress protein [Mycobacterium nebraskense]|uniref:general stress protein n=1 Tax=Mycobacterium nebraskense TaxID=244292 RepID=UPI002F3FEDE7